MHGAYPYLRTKLREMDIDQLYLGELLGRSHPYISARMNAKMPWTLEEQYQIMDLIHEPYENLHIVFPKRGVQRDWERAGGPQEALLKLDLIKSIVGAGPEAAPQAKPPAKRSGCHVG